MRSAFRILSLVLFCLCGTALSQHALPEKPGDSLLRKFFSDFNVPAAAEDAGLRLLQSSHNDVAIFVRMETAELEERPEVVLDSALRLCALRTSPELQEVASNRVLQHAGNTLAFNSVLRRVKSAAALQNHCTFNLRLALVAAAWDGAKVDRTRPRAPPGCSPAGALSGHLENTTTSTLNAAGRQRPIGFLSHGIP